MANTQYRVVVAPNQDITGRTITQDCQIVPYAATVALVTLEQTTDVYVETLTGALALSVNANTPLIGDRLTVIYAGGSSNETVTYGAGFAVSAATQVITASKYGTIIFVFNGIDFVEMSRTETV